MYFDTDKAEVKPESKAALDEMGKLLKANPNLKVYVVGHTDNQGTLARNLDLSQKRADAVVKALEADYKIAAARLSPRGVASLADAGIFPRTILLDRCSASSVLERLHQMGQGHA